MRKIIEKLYKCDVPSNHYNEDEDGLLARLQSAEYNETQMMEEKNVFILNSNQ